MNSAHYPPSGNVQLILLKFKWSPQVDFLTICDRKNSCDHKRTSGLLLSPARPKCNQQQYVLDETQSLHVN